MLHVAGVDQLEGPVGHAGVSGHVGIDVDVAQHVLLAGQVLLVHCQRQHNLHHLTGDASGRLRAGIHQDQGVGIAGDDFDVGIGLFVLDGNTTAGAAIILVVQHSHIAVVFVSCISFNSAVICRIICNLLRHGDGGQHGNCHHCADQQGQYPFRRSFFHCVRSSPVW